MRVKNSSLRRLEFMPRNLDKKCSSRIPSQDQNHRIYRVPGFLSSRPNWLLPPPHQPTSGTPPPLVPRGGGAHSLAEEGAEGANSVEGTDTLVLYNMV
jgi:hypothetical protein